MVQTVEILLDSSILIEHSKGTKRELMIEMLNHSATRLYYETTVVSEYLYHFLGFHGEKAPRTLKENKRISEILTEHDVKKLFSLFSQLTTNIPRVDEVLRFMESYNLLSNDAIILAHCKSARMRFVASYDSDFVIPCERGSITLIDSFEAFQKIVSIWYPRPALHRSWISTHL